MSSDERAAIAAILANVDSLDEINRIKILAQTPNGRASLLDGSYAAAASQHPPSTESTAATAGDVEDMDDLD